jgi:predicted  nucleic acid-binding Zn-ribbon protein
MEDAPALGGIETAADGLRGALEACAAAFEGAATAHGDVDALRAVIALDDALPALARLRAAVPPWLRRAEAGAEVAGHLDTVLDVDDLAGALADLRSAVDDAARGEQEHSARIAELRELRDRLVTLRRLERLAVALGELEGQRREIDARVAELAGPVTSSEKALSRGASDLIRLSEERCAALAPPVQDALRRAAEAEGRRQAAERALAAAREQAEQSGQRYDSLRAAREDRLAAQRRHLAADRSVAAGLSSAGALPGDGLTLATAALDDVQRQLEQVDGVLAEALDAARAKAPRAPVGWDAVPR